MPKPDITMFFPAYNEVENIPKLLDSAVRVLDETANNYEILVVVYEGSTDGTIDLVKKYSKKNKKIKLIIQPKEKKGIGYANTLGFRNAKYPYIFYADSDNQFDIAEFKKFLPYIGEYDVIAGYRIKRQDPFTRIIASKIYNIMMRVLLKVRERDLDCAFRLVNRRVIEKINLVCSTGVATTELLAKARKNRFKIMEMGVHHYPRKSGQPVFESRFFNFPKPKVVLSILKETINLYKDINSK
ncbi:MAG: glycosyltransferase family 2 protein [Nanoarchaeota archaeon]